MLTNSIAVLSVTALMAQSAMAVNAYDKISFANVGFAGTFQSVKKMSNIYDNSTCKCEVEDRQWFSGTNAPLADYLSVHFRGPLTLSKFAFYTSPQFVINDSSSSDWTRGAYYDASSQTSSNVTFLTKAGKNSPCLGNALSYASTNGTGSASAATLLESDNLISSDQEYSIFSNVSCPKSGTGKGCGVYRDDIPAYYGFGGTTKMFLFEFEMPVETQKNSSSFEYYDMPAIWLLNDHIPRTSQYPNNANCSCWASGCGEFDIFEVMNGTERNHLYSTFHTFQGIEDLGTGIQSYGYIPRDTSSTMRGGVIFDSNGNTVTFVSNSTTFDDSLTVSSINSLFI
ncbi:hypothetical protein NCAS_0B08380 [Naumovozyma castellii]|uniref:glucan endo-1,3-beta-D-glucosidase n=1 Tax=Naumovozyma castellii TaxID=27288 RepID=G0VAP6_NAUCA|nr:hypothetical protein NCAS_0B08380 [Naumovozyma castellii CBS 4309]CCC68922.1 hypothetical protein NCAS_0B08380 [Naumovozyma castellii CBS 4309]